MSREEFHGCNWPEEYFLVAKEWRRAQYIVDRVPPPGLVVWVSIRKLAEQEPEGASQ